MFRQLLTESVVLSLAGGVLGLAVTAAIMRAAPAMVPRRVPGLDQVGVDGTVLAFAAALSIGTGLLFGAAPTLAWARGDLVRTLNEANAPAAGGFGRLRASIGQAMLATGQVALARPGAPDCRRVALAQLRGAHRLRPGVRAAQCRHRPRRPPGPQLCSREGAAAWRPDQIEAMNAAERRATETLLLQMERVESLPGVETVALASQIPFGGIGGRPITVAGRPTPTDAREQTAGRNTVRQSRLRQCRPAPVAGRPLLHRPRRSRRPARRGRQRIVRAGGLRRRARGRTASGPARLPVSGSAARRRRPRSSDMGSHRRLLAPGAAVLREA